LGGWWPIHEEMVVVSATLRVLVTIGVFNVRASGVLR